MLKLDELTVFTLSTTIGNLYEILVKFGLKRVKEKLKFDIGYIFITNFATCNAYVLKFN